MYCKNCGNPISESTKFCANCGNQNEFFKDVSSEKEIVKDEGIENPIPKEDIYTSTIVNNIYESETNKKGNKGLLITLIIIGSIIVIVALVFAFIKLFPSNTSTGVSSNNAEETSSYNNNQSSNSNESSYSNNYSTSNTEEVNTVMGSEEMGYLTLPGKWLNIGVTGASETSVQYRYSSDISWIATLDLLDSSLFEDNIEYAGKAQYLYHQEHESDDATNLSITKDKIGSYDAYKVTCQYKSDGIWLSSWFFITEDGKMHMIQLEGKELYNDFFKIPYTFKLKK